MPTFEPLFGKVNESIITEFEVRNGLSLPDDYKHFLMTYNGGQPSPNQIDIPDCGEAAIVDLLYGIGGSGQSGDLDVEHENQCDELPEGFLPIGHDPGGNGLLLGTSGEHRGRVYYWDSSMFFESSDEHQNTYPIADNFEMFLTLIR